MPTLPSFGCSKAFDKLGKDAFAQGNLCFLTDTLQLAVQDLSSGDVTLLNGRHSALSCQTNEFILGKNTLTIGVAGGGLVFEVYAWSVGTKLYGFPSSKGGLA